MEARAVKFERSESSVHGVVVRYGETASIGDFRERFEPGAFGDTLASPALRVNLQHRRERPLAIPRFDDTPTALHAAFTLPDTSDGRDARALMETGVLTGLSMEFVPVEERFEGGVRVISRAQMLGLALVDYPAYSQSLVEFGKRWLEARSAGALPGNIRIPFL